jgi:hypothetical protein
LKIITLKDGYAQIQLNVLSSPRPACGKDTFSSQSEKIKDYKTNKPAITQKFRKPRIMVEHLINLLKNVQQLTNKNKK